MQIERGKESTRKSSVAGERKRSSRVKEWKERKKKRDLLRGRGGKRGKRRRGQERKRERKRMRETASIIGEDRARWTRRRTTALSTGINAE